MAFMQSGLTLFNDNWQFIVNEFKNVEEASSDKSPQWQSVTLPHDIAISGPFSDKNNARCGGLPIEGEAWYRKEFSVDLDCYSQFFVEFDGAMSNSEVWINGHYLGLRPYGYIGFEYNLTDYLKPDGNIIIVKLFQPKLSTRWYPGFGLYRNVWLKQKQHIRVAHWGSVVTTPMISTEKALVNVRLTLEGKPGDYQLRNSVVDASQQLLYQSNEQISLTLTQEEFHVALSVKEPQLWSCETPYLYQVITEVLDEKGEILEKYCTPFGIRELLFTHDRGCFINNIPLELKGVCLHHDNGVLGAIVNRRALERKLELLRDMGVNAIRTSHNPPSPEFLELCDNMGFVVQVEAFDVWRIPKTDNDYHQHFDLWAERDLKDMVTRDRNHPCVIMWSIGNEILEQGETDGWKVAKMLNDYVKEVDTTRPTTAGFNYYPACYENRLADQVDLVGLNYYCASYHEAIHERIPGKPVYGSETASCSGSRGIYHFPVEKYQKHESLQVTGYSLIGPPWAYPADVEFYFQRQNPEALGEFMWTGFDYLGEPTPYGGNDNHSHGYWNEDWPSKSSYFAPLDLCGFAKDAFYLYQSQWSVEPMVHLLPHWNLDVAEGTIIPVVAYTNCEEAELFVNGVSQGRKVKGVDTTRIPVDFYRYPDKHFDSPSRLSWDVPYVAGDIKVVAYNKGKVICEKQHITANNAYAIRLSADRQTITADGYDLSYITLDIVDDRGNFVPTADNRVEFDISGVGTLAGVGNGDATSLITFTSNYFDAFSGKCLAVVQASKNIGQIVLTATSQGLQSASVTIDVVEHKKESVK